MGKGDPTLVPEWLKTSSGSSARSSNVNHHMNSASQSDDSYLLAPIRSRPSHLRLSGSSNSDYDGSKSSLFGDRNSVSHFHRSSSSNGGITHDKEPVSQSRSYSSFRRNHRSYDYDFDRGTPRSDRNRDRERDFVFRERDVMSLGDVRDRNRNSADSLKNGIAVIGFDKETVKRSPPMVSSKKMERSESKVKRSGSELGVMNNGMSITGSYMTSIQKASFERDFPSLGFEDKHSVGADIGRVPSPGLCSVAQGLPVGSVAVIGGDGWTSALAEVPFIIGTNNHMLSSVQQSVAPGLSLMSPITPSGLNMAETLLQAPARPQTTPQLSVETQKLEELAIKHSRQLIPVISSVPKNSVKQRLFQIDATYGEPSTFASVISALSSSDKPKVRPGSLLVNSLRGPVVKADTPKPSQGGKLLVLNPNREKNGNSPMRGDNLGSSSTNVISNSSSTVPSVTGLKNSKIAADVKLPISTGLVPDDKRMSSAQSQNRIEFFNSLRRKTAITSVTSDLPGSTLSCDTKSTETAAEAAFSVQMKHIPVADSEGAVHVNGGESVMISSDSGKGADSNGGPIIVAPEEEEAAFLRSLGWEENDGEEALTEEEINAFYELLKLRPSASFRQKGQNDSVPESNG